MARNEKAACIWHAFNALDVPQAGTVSKRQLKVLTHNIGNILGLEDIEKSLEEFRSSETITFLDYLYFLKVELFAQLEEKESKEQQPPAVTPPANAAKHILHIGHHHKGIPANVSKCDWDKIDEVCWFVCCKKYLEREKKVLSEDCVYKLWRVFNFVAEVEGEVDTTLVYPVVIHKEEAQIVIQKILTVLGLQFDQGKFASNFQDTDSLLYEQFLQATEEACTCDGANAGPDLAMATLSIGEVYEEYIVEVLKKGYGHKKGHVMTAWKERWFVLSPHSLRYFTSRDEKDMKGDVPLTPNCKAEPLPDKAIAKPNRFQLVSEGKTYEISAPDMKSRSEWVSALKQAIDYCNKPQSPQRVASRRRHSLRQESRSRAEEERRRQEADREEMRKTQERLAAESEQLARTRDELEKLGAITEAEREARAKLEATLEEEARQRREDQLRMQELEELKQQLEDTLEAERQAKRDEEIVRNLQARILAEEFEKREQLEKLQEELKDKWREEQQKREGLEEWKEQQEMMLREEQQRLEELERKRRDADQNLQEALEKLSEAEQDKQKLAQKLEDKKKTGGFKVSFMKKLEPMIEIISSGSSGVSHRGLGFLPRSESTSSSRNTSEEKEILAENNNDPTKDVSDDLVKVALSDDLVKVTHDAEKESTRASIGNGEPHHGEVFQEESGETTPAADADCGTGH